SAPAPPQFPPTRRREVICPFSRCRPDDRRQADVPRGKVMPVSFRSPRGRVRTAVWVLAIGLTFTGALRSQPAGAEEPTRESLQQQIDQLKRDLDRLNRANAAIEPMVDEKINKQWVTAGFNLKDGFFIQDPSKEYRLRFRGYTQMDGRFFIDDSPQINNDQFLFRRVRPVLEGSLTKFVDFRIIPDFAGSTFRLFDAYVDFKPFDVYRDWLKIRA